jgi:hypothetical protein
MATVTIRYGVTNTVTREFSDELTISDLVSDRNILGSLNAPEGCVAIYNGNSIQSNAGVEDYDGLQITLEKQASSKA